MDGVHPLFFEGGRRPPTNRVSAGWTGVHALIFEEGGRRPPTYFFPFAKPHPGHEGREQVWWCATASDSVHPLLF